MIQVSFRPLASFALAALVGAAICSPGFADETKQSDAAALPRVLILGDSISIGYTPFVKEELAGEAEVFRPTNAKGGPENCAGTTNGVEKIDEWLARDGGDWDVIHVNFGLHDLKHVDPKTNANSDDPNHPRQAEPEIYEKQYDAILAAAKKTGAKLIVATTTPVPEGKVRPHRDPADVPRYNAIAVKLAGKHGAEVDDLYAFADARLSEIQRPVNVHFTDEGSKALAEKVAASIREALSALNAEASGTKSP